MNMVEIEASRLASGGSGVTRRRTIMGVLTHPTIDRTIGIVAVLPFIYPTYQRLTGNLLNFPNLASIAASIVLISTMFARRPPVRVTPNPFFWLLAFVTTYGTFLPFLFATPGRPVLPTIATELIATMSLIVTVYARISLGRNIGFVPAQRRLVTRGAYGLVRHPIYTGIFLGYLGATLRNYTPLYSGLAAGVCSLFVIKSFVEEAFLRKDPQYAEYMKLVRYRWVPGLL